MGSRVILPFADVEVERIVFADRPELDDVASVGDVGDVRRHEARNVAKGHRGQRHERAQRPALCLALHG